MSLIKFISEIRITHAPKSILLIAQCPKAYPFSRNVAHSFRSNADDRQDI